MAAGLRRAAEPHRARLRRHIVVSHRVEILRTARETRRSGEQASANEVPIVPVSYQDSVFTCQRKVMISSVISLSNEVFRVQMGGYNIAYIAQNAHHTPSSSIYIVAPEAGHLQSLSQRRSRSHTCQRGKREAGVGKSRAMRLKLVSAANSMYLYGNRH